MIGVLFRPLLYTSTLHCAGISAPHPLKCTVFIIKCTQTITGEAVEVNVLITDPVGSIGANFMGTCPNSDNLAQFAMTLVLVVAFCRDVFYAKSATERIMGEQLIGLFLATVSASRLLLIPCLVCWIRR